MSCLFKFPSISFITFELSRWEKEKDLNIDTNCKVEIIDILDRIQVITYCYAQPYYHVHISYSLIIMLVSLSGGF